MKQYDMDTMIKYEDDMLIVCEKPAGLPVQSAKLGQMDLEHLLKNYLAGRTPGAFPYVGVVHRLDQPVEGLLVFGKTKKATAALSKQLQNHQLKKTYLAVVHGKPKRESGKFCDFLKKDGKTNTSSVVSEKMVGAKKALLSYCLKDFKKELSLVKIEIETGRHHQIRVQMSSHGLPLMGDKKYGKEDGCSQLALCANDLQFFHPSSGKKMQVTVFPRGEAFSEFFC